MAMQRKPMKQATKTEHEKPSILFILTGLGRYSWWQLPFFKGVTFCRSLPGVIFFYIKWAFAFVLHFSHGSCRCNLHNCTWVRFFDLTIGLCESARQIRAAK
jgi:hypothetical protein